MQERCRPLSGKQLRDTTGPASRIWVSVLTKKSEKERNMPKVSIKKGRHGFPSNFNWRFSVPLMQNYFRFLHVKPWPWQLICSILSHASEFIKSSYLWSVLITAGHYAVPSNPFAPLTVRCHTLARRNSFLLPCPHIHNAPYNIRKIPRWHSHARRIWACCYYIRVKSW
jgi:hypothetical protein